MRWNRCRASRWTGPAGFAGCGLVLAGVEVAGHQPVGQVIFALALFGVIAVALALGGSRETVRALRGDLRDERLTGIELHAQALAGRLVVIACVVAWLVELALGHSGAPFYWLSAIGGFTYLVAYLTGMRR